MLLCGRCGENLVIAVLGKSFEIDLEDLFENWKGMNSCRGEQALFSRETSTFVFYFFKYSVI